MLIKLLEITFCLLAPKPKSDWLWTNFSLVFYVFNKIYAIAEKKHLQKRFAAITLKTAKSLFQYVRQSVRLFVCLSVRPSVRPSVRETSGVK